MKLADFGAGRRLGPTARPLLLDYVGFWPGDTRYTPPELIAGLNDHDPGIARAADIYALGCILYRVLTGKEVFEGTAQEVLRLRRRTS